MLYISLVFSGILFAFSFALVMGAKEPRSKYLAVWLGLPFGFITICMFFLMPAYLLHALLFGVVATVCRYANIGRRGFLWGGVVAFVIAYTVVGVPQLLETRRFLRDYPMESLESRLTYEPGRAETAPTSPSLWNQWSDAPELGATWKSNFRLGARRIWALERLHEDQLFHFVSAPGFGVGRMIYPPLDEILAAATLRNAPPVNLPEPPQPGETPVQSTGDLTLSPSVEVPGLSAAVGSDNLELMQRETAGDFLDPIGFGYARDRGHVAGFISHRMTKNPPKPESPAGGGHWRIEFIDLVSLWKYAQPVAYVSKHLPRMDELRNAPTRPLDEFEAEHLPKLRVGEEIAYAKGLRRIRMLGAIRAREECLKCHSVDEKTLLGAFSYDLRLDR